jgi:Ras-related protein Rab-5C
MTSPPSRPPPPPTTNTTTTATKSSFLSWVLPNHNNKNTSKDNTNTTTNNDNNTNNGQHSKSDEINNKRKSTTNVDTHTNKHLSNKKTSSNTAAATATTTTTTTTTAHRDPPVPLKIVLVGDSGSGKSCLLTKFIQEEFIAETQPTAGAFVANKMIELEDERQFDLSIWDTAGDDRYKSLIPTFTRGANVALVIFDVTRIDSYERAKLWVDDLKRRMPTSGMMIALIGNKIDLVDGRQISETDAKQYVKQAQINGGYFETSAKDLGNIGDIIKSVIALLPKKLITVSSS